MIKLYKAHNNKFIENYDNENMNINNYNNNYYNSKNNENIDK